MYNKLFTKILDSSIWLEPQPTRLVWLTFLAAMDETSFVGLSSVENVAHRARVSLEEAANAIKCLESPDRNGLDQDSEGRRIERTANGWIVIKGPEYRAIAVAEDKRRQNAERQRRYRERNAPVTHSDVFITPAEAEATTEATTSIEDPASFPNQAENQRDPRANDSAPVTNRPVRTPNHSKTSNLINGRSQLEHGQHVWCCLDRPSLCVTLKVHEQCLDRLGGDKSAARKRLLTEIYPAAIRALGDKPAPDLFPFWRGVMDGYGGVAPKGEKPRTGATVPGYEATKALLESL